MQYCKQPAVLQAAMQYYKQQFSIASSHAILQAVMQYYKQPGCHISSQSVLQAVRQYYKQLYSIASNQQHYKHLGNYTGNHTDNITLSQAV
jgi:hypothetical protein